MEKIKKIEDDIQCDKCENQAVTRIKTEGGAPLRLCKKHEEEFAEELRNKMKDKFEGMSEKEIAKKVFQEGESLL